MNQTISWSVFSSGLIAFAATGGEIISQHKTFSDLNTPLGMFHLVILGMSFMATIGGALAAQLPRETSHNERVDDHKEEDKKK